MTDRCRLLSAVAGSLVVARRDEHGVPRSVDLPSRLEGLEALEGAFRSRGEITLPGKQHEIPVDDIFTKIASPRVLRSNRRFKYSLNSKMRTLALMPAASQ